MDKSQTSKNKMPNDTFVSFVQNLYIVSLYKIYKCKTIPWFCLYSLKYKNMNVNDEHQNLDWFSLEERERGRREHTWAFIPSFKRM